jgi:hypothetical protein
MKWNELAVLAHKHKLWVGGVPGGTAGCLCIHIYKLKEFIVILQAEYL